MTCARPVGNRCRRILTACPILPDGGATVPCVVAHDAHRPSSMDRGFPSLAVHGRRRSRLHDGVDSLPGCPRSEVLLPGWSFMVVHRQPVG